jgi:hypothetical protein
MPQDQEKNAINPKDLLLPTKEAHTPASAQRVNAGVLLEGEQNAELPKVEAAPIQPAERPQGPIDSAPIAPLQTYERDVESVITQKNISAVDIAAAESARNGKNSAFIPQTQFDFTKIKRVGAFVASLLFVVGAGGLLYFAFLRPEPTAVNLTPANTPFIAVDDTQALVLAPEQLKRSILMNNLVALKEKTMISLGLISRFYVTISSTSTAKTLPPAITAQTLLSTLAPNASDDFLRTLDPNYYILGIHTFDGNQSFLILKVDSYEQGFSGMLAWERTMQSELSPLFTRTPRPKISSEEIAVSSGTPIQISPTQFQDKIVENHDTRVIINDAGDILLLWTFLDRNTLVITTNEATLRELISRRSTFVSQK